VIIAVAYTVPHKARESPTFMARGPRVFFFGFLSDAPGKNLASRLVAQPSDDQRPATDEGELAMKIVVIGGTGLISSKSVGSGADE
jgi:hypothetical protein